MAKQNSLTKNTILFGLGELSTKLLQFLIAPLLTFLLTTEQYGQIDVINTFSSLIIPFVSVSAVEYVFRFAADNSEDKTSVFTISLIICLAGAFLLIPISIFFNAIYNNEAEYFVYIYIVFVMMHNVFHYFIKGLGKTTIYILNSILFACGTSLLTFFLISNFNYGIKTYYFSYIITILLCLLFMFISCKLWRFISFKNIKKTDFIRMFKYSIPLIFNSLGWWAISASDILLTNYFLGDSSSGILAVSHKIPTIVTAAYGIFGSAFQLFAFSALDFTKTQSKGIEQRYQSYLDRVLSLLTILVSLIVLFCKPVVSSIVSKEFFDSWKYIPIYTLAILFYNSSAFLGYLYTVSRRNGGLFISTFICGLINIILCFVFYYFLKIGIYAAAISSLLSYFFIFIYRYFDSKKLLKIYIHKKHILSFVLLFSQIIVSIVLQQKNRELFTANFIIASFILFLNKDFIKTILFFIKSKLKFLHKKDSTKI